MAWFVVKLWVGRNRLIPYDKKTSPMVIQRSRLHYRLHESTQCDIRNPDRAAVFHWTEQPPRSLFFPCSLRINKTDNVSSYEFFIDILEHDSKDSKQARMLLYSARPPIWCMRNQAVCPRNWKPTLISTPRNPRWTEFVTGNIGRRWCP